MIVCGENCLPTNYLNTYRKEGDLSQHGPSHLLLSFPRQRFPTQMGQEISSAVPTFTSWTQRVSIYRESSTDALYYSMEDL